MPGRLPNGNQLPSSVVNYSVSIPLARANCLSQASNAATSAQGATCLATSAMPPAILYAAGSSGPATAGAVAYSASALPDEAGRVRWHGDRRLPWLPAGAFLAPGLNKRTDAMAGRWRIAAGSWSASPKRSGSGWATATPSVSGCRPVTSGTGRQPQPFPAGCSMISRLSGDEMPMARTIALSSRHRPRLSRGAAADNQIKSGGMAFPRFANNSLAMAGRGEHDRPQSSMFGTSPIGGLDTEIPIQAGYSHHGSHSGAGQRDYVDAGLFLLLPVVAAGMAPGAVISERLADELTPLLAAQRTGRVTGEALGSGAGRCRRELTEAHDAPRPPLSSGTVWASIPSPRACSRPSRPRCRGGRMKSSGPRPSSRASVRPRSGGWRWPIWRRGGVPSPPPRPR